MAMSINDITTLLRNKFYLDPLTTEDNAQIIFIIRSMCADLMIKGHLIDYSVAGITQDHLGVHARHAIDHIQIAFKTPDGIRDSYYFVAVPLYRVNT